jgi:hypothetical protein
MFMNMTIIQQLFLVFLALFLLRLALCILAKLKLMPLLVYALCTNLVFPDWTVDHPLLYRGIFAALAVITILRWVGPKLAEHLEERRLMEQISAQAHAAREMGYQNGQFHFVVEDGNAVLKFDE